MALDRAAPLGHAVRLRALHVPCLDQAGLAENVGGKDRALPADTYDQDIVTAGHLFPSRTIAPTGTDCTHRTAAA